MPIPIDGGGVTALEKVRDELALWREKTYTWWADSLWWVFPLSLIHSFIYTIYHGVYMCWYWTSELCRDYGPFVDFVNTLLETRNLSTAMKDLFFDWGEFTDDPVLFIRNRVSDILRIGMPYKYLPERWLPYLFCRWVGIDYYWTDDGGSIFDRLLRKWFAGWTDFLDHPWASILDYLYEHDYATWNLVHDPVNWLKLQFGDWLELRAGFTIDFWGATVEKAFEWIGGHETEIAAYVYKPGERILKHLWEGE